MFIKQLADCRFPVYLPLVIQTENGTRNYVLIPDILKNECILVKNVVLEQGEPGVWEHDVSPMLPQGGNVGETKTFNFLPAGCSEQPQPHALFFHLKVKQSGGEGTWGIKVLYFILNVSDSPSVSLDWEARRKEAASFSCLRPTCLSTSRERSCT